MNHTNIQPIANTMFDMSHATYPQAHDPVHHFRQLASTNLYETANILCWAGSGHDASYDWFSSTPVLFNVQFYHETKTFSQSVSSATIVNITALPQGIDTHCMVHCLPLWAP